MTITTSTLPAGVTFNPETQTFLGVFPDEGEYWVKVTATNAEGSRSKKVRLRSYIAPVITSEAPTLLGVPGDLIEWTMVVLHNPTYFTTDTLPDSLTFDSVTLTLSGYYPVDGDYAFTITAHNPAGSDTLAFTLTSLSPPIFDGSNTLVGWTGYAFEDTIIATNTVDSFSASDLPSGFSINTLTGVITGTLCPAIGSYSFTVTATNSQGTSRRVYTLRVVESLPAPALSGADGAYNLVGRNISYSIVATNSPTQVVVTGLPTGFTYTKTRITGKATAGLLAENVVITVSNPAGTATKTITIAEAIPAQIVYPELSPGDPGTNWTLTPTEIIGRPAPTITFNEGAWRPIGTNVVYDPLTKVVTGTHVTGNWYQLYFSASNGFGKTTTTTAWIKSDLLPTGQYISDRDENGEYFPNRGYYMPGEVVNMTRYQFEAYPPPTYTFKGGQDTSGCTLNSSTGELTITAAAVATSPPSWYEACRIAQRYLYIYVTNRVGTVQFVANVYTAGLPQTSTAYTPTPVRYGVYALVDNTYTAPAIISTTFENPLGVAWYNCYGLNPTTVIDNLPAGITGLAPATNLNNPSQVGESAGDQPTQLLIGRVTEPGSYALTGTVSNNLGSKPISFSFVAVTPSGPVMPNFEITGYVGDDIFYGRHAKSPVIPYPAQYSNYYVYQSTVLKDGQPVTFTQPVESQQTGSYYQSYYWAQTASILRATPGTTGSTVTSYRRSATAGEYGENGENPEMLRTCQGNVMYPTGQPTFPLFVYPFGDTYDPVDPYVPQSFPATPGTYVITVVPYSFGVAGTPGTVTLHALPHAPLGVWAECTGDPSYVANLVIFDAWHTEASPHTTSCWIGYQFYYFPTSYTFEIVTGSNLISDLTFDFATSYVTFNILGPTGTGTVKVTASNSSGSYASIFKFKIN